MSVSRLILCGRSKRQRLQQGPLGTYMDRFADRYIEQGYGREYSVASLKAVDQFGRRLKGNDLMPCDIDEQRIERYLRNQSVPLHPCSRVALHKFLGLLREIGVCPPAAAVAKGAIQILEDEFTQYLAKDRGLAARTIEHYGEAAHAFLMALPDAERRLGTLTAADVLGFIQRRAETRKPVHMQQLCTGLRAFLRYLQFRGKTRTDLARSVPRIARWRLATLPKFLSRAQVRQVLAHCDRSTAIGRRDHAVLMLLARLGLRAEEVRLLTLDDIDWRGGQLTIRGKARPPEPMPLPQGVGKALAAYLTDGRPASSSRTVFVRMMPPHIPLAGSTSVTSLVERAMDAAHVTVPSKGAHIFRYTLATQMLRDGASLREIGQVLRHRHEDTTRIYAKVDLVRLRTLAMPWPGGAV